MADYKQSFCECVEFYLNGTLNKKQAIDLLESRYSAFLPTTEIYEISETDYLDYEKKRKTIIQKNFEGSGLFELYAEKLFNERQPIIEFYEKQRAFIENYTDNAPQYSPAENVVMMYYPQFKNDYPKLIDNGYMKRNGDCLKWNSEKTQKVLALYFSNLKSKDGKNHWKEIETLFGECNLRQSANNDETSGSKKYQELLKFLKT